MQSERRRWWQSRLNMGMMHLLVAPNSITLGRRGAPLVKELFRFWGGERQILISCSAAPQVVDQRGMLWEMLTSMPKSN